MPSTTLRVLLEALNAEANYTPSTNAAGSVEPMRRADHKSKKHSRPMTARAKEKIGGGHFVFKRGDRTGRIENRGLPYEHPDAGAAIEEAGRLQGVYGGTYDVFSRVAVVDGGNDLGVGL